MNDDSIGLQQPLLLSPDLLGHSQPIRSIRELRSEFRGTKEPAILNGIERPGGQEIQRTLLPKVDAMMQEDLSFEVTKINSNRTRLQFEQNPAKPWFELGGEASG